MPRPLSNPSRLPHLLRFLLLWALPILLPRPGVAQYERPPAPAAYALTGVSVVQGDGARVDGVTVVIREGLVQALAADAPIPADARMLEGEGLILYPGMIDGQGDVSVEFPDPTDTEEGADVTAWDPPRSRQGFLPHRRVADALTITGDDLDDHREDGIVASLIHPGGRMAPGQPAVLVHRHADSPWALVNDAAAGVTMSFQSAGGVYPSQLFGVIAYLRQAFLDAERYAAMKEAERQGRGGFLPPGWDPDYEVLLAAARGETPVFFQADADEDIRRVLKLADEFGFSVQLVGGSEAWKLGDELRERNIPVWVSLDFPSPDAWDPEEDTVAAELTPEQVREKEELENTWSNAARLVDAGVTVALTSGGGGADFPEGLRKVVDYGLSPGDALAAATATPARLLGVTGLSRIRAGHPATFIVASGDLLEEDTEIRYTFVEGHLTEGVLPGAEPASDEGPAGDLTGSWTGELTAMGSDAPATMVLTQDEDGGLSGTLTAESAPPGEVEGSIAGSSITLSLTFEGLPEPITLSGSLSPDGQTVSGEGSTPFGEIEFTLERDGSALVRLLSGGNR